MKHLTKEDLEFLQQDYIDSNKKVLEREYYEREEERVDEEVIEKKILDIEFNKKEIKKVKKDVKNIIQYTVLDKWMRLFNQASFKNEDAIQILFHVVLGQMLSSLKIYLKSGDYLDYREHFMWLQQSRTGKGKAINLIFKICEELKKHIIVNNKKIMHKMRFKKMGKVTDAGLVNNWKIDKKGKLTNQIKYGVLEKFDVICWEEAKKLIKSGNNYNEDEKEILMTVMEPIDSLNNLWDKDLKDYDESCPTKSSASLIATTRPIGNLRPELLYEGLFQRFLVIVRNVTSKTRKKMREKVALSSFQEEDDNFDEQLKEVASEIQKIYEFAIKSKISIRKEDFTKILNFINQKLEWFDEDIEQNIGKKENCEIMEAFVGGFRDHILKLAHHSTVMRRSSYLEIKDIEYAFELIKKSYESIKIWVEESMTIDIDTEKKESSRKFIIEKTIKRAGGKIKKSDLIKYLIKELEVSYPTASKILNDYLGKKTSRFLEKNKLISLSFG